MRALPADAVDALAVLAFRRVDGERHLLVHDGAQESAQAVLLPPRRGHHLAEGRSVRRTQQRQDLVLPADRGRCGFGARGRFLRLGGRDRLRDLRRFERLDPFPDAAHGGAAVLELAHGGDSRQAVPDFDQTRDRPVAADGLQFLFGVEHGAFGCARFAVAQHADRVLLSDAESFHDGCFSLPLVAVRT